MADTEAQKSAAKAAPPILDPIDGPVILSIQVMPAGGAPPPPPIHIPVDGHVMLSVHRPPAQAAAKQAPAKKAPGKKAPPLLDPDDGPVVPARMARPISVVARVSRMRRDS